MRTEASPRRACRARQLEQHCHIVADCSLDGGVCVEGLVGGTRGIVLGIGYQEKATSLSMFAHRKFKLSSRPWNSSQRPISLKTVVSSAAPCVQLLVLPAKENLGPSASKYSGKISWTPFELISGVVDVVVRQV